MEVETFNTTAHNQEEDGDISGPSTAVPTVPVSEKNLDGIFIIIINLFILGKSDSKNLSTIKQTN